MKSLSNGSKKINLIGPYLGIGMFFLILYPYQSGDIYILNYIAALVAYFIMTGVLLLSHLRKRLDIFEPIVLFSFIYILMFSITPLLDILLKETLWFGQDLLGNGVEGIIYAVIGYIAFYLGYIIKLTVRKGSTKRKNIIDNKNYYNRNFISYISVALWILFFILTMIYLSVDGGKSITYILSLGLIGEVAPENIQETSLGVLSMFSYSLIPLALLYSEFGESKIIKYTLFILTLSIQIIRGFRFIILICIFSVVIYSFLKNKKRPSISKLVQLLGVAIVVISIVGFLRNDIRSGSGTDWDSFNFESIVNPILENFRIYKTYYGILNAVPSIVPFMYGEQMFLYTLILFIPRAIWPLKPDAPGSEAVIYGVSNYANEAGTAYPIIGEFYYEFGLLGIIIFMYIFGIMCRNLMKLYLNGNDDSFDIMIYSIMLPAILQLVIRGYTPSNFYMILFLIGPLITIKKLSKKGKLNE